MYGRAWIIERLDRKLADAIGSNIVEKCDFTLSRAIQPHSTFCASDVSSHISLSLSSTIHIGHVLKLRMKMTCCWRRQLEGTKPIETEDRVNDYETCESDE